MTAAGRGRGAEKGAPETPLGPLAEVASLFLKLGLVAFGGPAAHIALMRRETVERRRWLDDARFLDLLAASNLLPGPTSTELAMLLGHARAGWQGLVVAGVLFILPAALLVGVLAWGYVSYGSTPQIAWLLYGVQPVVLAVVIHAIVGLGRTAIRGLAGFVVAVLAGAVFLVGVNPVLVLVITALGLLAAPAATRVRSARASVLFLPVRSGTTLEPASRALAAAPDLAVLFFTFLKIGAVVYGSGYVLVAFLRADLVEGLGWLTDRQLLDAVAVGQLTPGPVFTTATFAGFLVAGVPGAMLATVAVFLPAFVLAALAHPIVSRLRGSPRTRLFLDGMAAAALGLMAGVTVQLARVAIVDPVTATVAVVTLVLMLRSRVDPIWLILAGALAGFGHEALGA